MGRAACTAGAQINAATTDKLARKRFLFILNLPLTNTRRNLLKYCPKNFPSNQAHAASRCSERLAQIEDPAILSLTLKTCVS